MSQDPPAPKLISAPGPRFNMDKFPTFLGSWPEVLLPGFSMARQTYLTDRIGHALALLSIVHVPNLQPAPRSARFETFQGTPRSVGCYVRFTSLMILTANRAYTPGLFPRRWKTFRNPPEKCLASDLRPWIWNTSRCQNEGPLDYTTSVFLGEGRKTECQLK
jgi:hypothetical protein